MSTLICPHCRLEVTTVPGGIEVEHCPRCLARSGGALSVYLSAKREPTRRRHLIAERLLRRHRSGQWART
jgi:Zn-finger nucleic acid-binding protein